MTVTRQPAAPAVQWHKSAGQFYARIGFRYNSRGRRIQAWHMLGENQRDAQKKAIEISERWDEVVAEARRRFTEWLQADEGKRYRQFGETSRNLWRGHLENPNLWLHREQPDGFELGNGFLPVWPDRPQAKQQIETIRRLVLKSQGSDITIAQVVQQYTDSERQRVGLAAGKGISERSYRAQATDLRNSLRFLDTTLPLNLLDYAALEKFVQQWMALPEAAETSQVAGKRISVRTAKNYCVAFKRCLDWAANRPNLEYVLPKGADALFAFRNANPVSVRVFSDEQLRQLLCGRDLRALYTMLAVNFGWYQVDLQTFAWDHLKQIDGEWFVQRQREKTSHQNRFEGCWYVWPETKALLDTFAAPKPNKHNLVLLKDGEPLTGWHINWAVFGDNEDKSRFKDFRKTGATWMENHHGAEISRLYKANAQAAEEKQYVRQSYVKLTAALKSWRDVLLARAVLPPVQGE